jgi:hypothetical protein
MLNPKSFRRSALLGALSLAILACKAGADDTAAGGSPSSGTQANGSTTGSNAGGGGNGTASVTSSSTGFGTVSSNGVGGGSCAATSVQTQLLPLDMVVILDKSGSMVGMKWDTATAALKTFVGDPLNDGISVGLVFFPNNSADDCNFLDYQNLDVEIGALPGNKTLLVSAINGQMADGGDTPTFGALKGGLNKATAYQDQHPDHKVIAVFASDGDPSACNTSIPAIAALAASAHNYNGVETYVIAMAGATLANLNQIAAAGGTNQAYDVTSNAQQFSQKMQEIRSSALACEFILPPPPMGQTLDPKLVNVNYTPGGAPTPTTLPQSDNLADCGVGPGWYYDDPMNPTKIVLCPASCNTIKVDSQAKIDVAFGCLTIPN